MTKILSIIISYLIKCFPSLTITITISLIVIILIIIISHINKNLKSNSYEEKKSKTYKVACISSGYPPIKTTKTKN